MVDDPFAIRFTREFSSGEVIFREAEEGAEMFVIQRGQVRLTRRAGASERGLATLGRGEFFGEMAILNKKPRSATATALDEVAVMVLDAPTLEGMIRRSGDVAMRVVHRLAARIDSSNSFVEIILHADPRARVILAIARRAAVEGVRVDEGLRVRGSVAELAAELGLREALVTEVVAGLLRVRVLLADAEGRWIVSEPAQLRAFVELIGASAGEGE